MTVSTKILAALQKQDKSVQELSTKMDNNFAGLTEKLESYLAEQQTLRQKKLQTEADFYSGLERQNVALTSIFDNDSKETEEYIKKSNAFNEQMMSLIQAKAKEEESFLKSRYLTLIKLLFTMVSVITVQPSPQTKFLSLVLSKCLKCLCTLYLKKL